MPPKGRFSRKKDEGAEAPKERVLPKRRVDYDLPDAICVLLENFFTISECERYLSVLQTDLDWKRQQVAVSQKEALPEAVVAEPRMTLFMSEPGICYEYSGRENVGEGWNDAVLEIKKKAEQGLVECGHAPVVFNSVQLNRYNGPRHTLGMHADDEPDLLKGAPIVSVSFGCTREFSIKRKDQIGATAKPIDLTDGSLLLMGGDMQTYYVHGVPAGGLGQTGLRLNLTFRVCIPRPPRQVAGAVQLLSSSKGKGKGKLQMDISEASPEVQQFINEHDLDARATTALLTVSPEEQQFVMASGPVTAANQSAGVLSRLRDAKAAIGGSGEDSQERRYSGGKGYGGGAEKGSSSKGYGKGKGW